MGNLADPALDIPRLVRRFGIQAVVETGCGHGGSMIVARELGLEYLGCDVDPEAVAVCRQLWPGAIVALNDSRQFLRGLMQQAVPWSRRTLWFLDAHGFAEGEDGFPLLAELLLLRDLKDGIEHDVVICDDLRCVADEANPRWREGELDPYGSQYIRGEQPFGAYVSALSSVLQSRVEMASEGYLIFEPTSTVDERPGGLPVMGGEVPAEV